MTITGAKVCCFNLLSTGPRIYRQNSLVDDKN